MPLLRGGSVRRRLLQIPGTVVHAASARSTSRPLDGLEYVRDRSFLEMRRGLFFKASYLWRL